MPFNSFRRLFRQDSEESPPETSQSSTMGGINISSVPSIRPSIEDMRSYLREQQEQNNRLAAQHQRMVEQSMSMTQNALGRTLGVGLQSQTLPRERSMGVQNSMTMQWVASDWSSSIQSDDYRTKNRELEAQVRELKEKNRLLEEALCDSVLKERDEQSK